MQPVAWRWTRRDETPEPRAVVAWGRFAAQLTARLSGLGQSHQARLLATASLDVLVVCGASVDLPWVDGAHYAAPSVNAPALWLPTLWTPDAPLDLLERALQHRYERQPLLLWPHPNAVIPLDRQAPLCEGHLQRIQALAHGARGAR